MTTDAMRSLAETLALAIEMRDRLAAAEAEVERLQSSLAAAVESENAAQARLAAVEAERDDWSRKCAEEWATGEIAREDCASLRAEVEGLKREKAELVEWGAKAFGSLAVASGNQTLAADMIEKLEARALAAEAERDRLGALLDDCAGFVAIAVADLARHRGLPDGHIVAEHYDLLARLGLRVAGFTRVPAQ